MIILVYTAHRVEKITTVEDPDREDALTEATAEDVEAAIREIEEGSKDEPDSLAIGS